MVKAVSQWLFMPMFFFLLALKKIYYDLPETILWGDAYKMLD